MNTVSPLRGKGELFVIGLGPGDVGLMAPDAREALERCETVAGYSAYLRLVPQELLKAKKTIASGMRGEVERCSLAIATALEGERVCLVCSGDPGVYAMAGLVLELMHARKLSLAKLPLTVVPGIPAVCSAAALLGAPLTHDFACVSLSDLLTPWEKISRRLDRAFEADFVLALFNPRSHKRVEQLDAALQIARRYRHPSSPVGHVRNAYRPGQEVCLTRLEDFRADTADMLSIIVIGNSNSRFLPSDKGLDTDWQGGARFYTPRGYEQKYQLHREKAE